MDHTHLPLTLWFWSAYLMATHTPGISAVQLQRQLRIGRYETAWLILHKLRRAMIAPERGTQHVDVGDGVRGRVEAPVRADAFRALPHRGRGRHGNVGAAHRGLQRRAADRAEPAGPALVEHHQPVGV